MFYPYKPLINKQNSKVKEKKFNSRTIKTNKFFLILKKHHLINVCFILISKLNTNFKNKILGQSVVSVKYQIICKSKMFL